MAGKLRLDRGGIAEVLKSAKVRSVVDLSAETVAARVSETARNGDPIKVTTDSYTTDRAAAGVTLAHPAGLGIEAKRGSLARAAASAGLEVTSRSRA